MWERTVGENWEDGENIRSFNPNTSVPCVRGFVAQLFFFAPPTFHRSATRQPNLYHIITWILRRIYFQWISNKINFTLRYLACTKTHTGFSTRFRNLCTKLFHMPQNNTHSFSGFSLSFAKQITNVRTEIYDGHFLMFCWPCISVKS